MLRELTIGRGLPELLLTGFLTRPAQREHFRSELRFPCPWPWSRLVPAQRSNQVGIPKPVSTGCRQRGKRCASIPHARSRFGNDELRPDNVVCLPSLPRPGRLIREPPGSPAPVP